MRGTDTATGTSVGQWQQQTGQKVGRRGLQAELLLPTPGRVTLSNVSERKDNMRLGLSLATNPKDNSFLVRATCPTLSPNPSPSAPWTLCLGCWMCHDIHTLHSTHQTACPHTPESSPSTSLLPAVP